MPQNEVESHPYLDIQMSKANFHHGSFTTLLLGTFPIYELTKSEPIEAAGVTKRTEWTQQANFKFFYGSKGNSFWKILANIAGTEFPSSTESCLKILAQQNIFIGDVIASASRIGYSSKDQDLTINSLNRALQNTLDSLTSIQQIVFTSDVAKRVFTEIIGIPNARRIQTMNLNNRNISMYTLPTPAGNGRSVRRFFKDFPPTAEEIVLIEKKLPYALAYRERLYRQFLQVI
ncbi:hypothetical protein [Phnomibacter ginsenosidimutans]|uniref:Uracil-DNA glycosylase family protein n=1 Tax=Phnomibacter ginsenosidimutans TaxID=2676868 RepID=A0A6I6H2X4_9BACT|nr:hypothetical protein [Phnomibacter ginsenosidimutans]QGW28911.1 hypothetical protein GLV81_13110 [Phnomibacter ginsenosidimutans]